MCFSDSVVGLGPLCVCLSVCLKSGLGFRYHVCIMAYGQTGSGKSFTMLGPHAQDAPASRDELGILPRAAHELFRYLGRRGEQRCRRRAGRAGRYPYQDVPEPQMPETRVTRFCQGPIT